MQKLSQIIVVRFGLTKPIHQKRLVKTISSWQKITRSVNQCQLNRRLGNKNLKTKSIKTFNLELRRC